MIATCPACRWPCSSAVSAHRFVSYVRCVCGLFLVVERGVIIATAGTSTFAPIHHTRGDLASVPDREPS
ncbi:hypothetical protein [Lentzea flava]|uniref:Uncharacterized protein n=1 Tax=Lentzea flava TaxID=103732 RepID=A0ABQ2UBD5_9PSEU|nr:hypothetical protein [Lentzea flava]MCP2197034.1 hypothetical protein [Lentzea flava]GGU13798.1 hypothetical protein GCM10010178_01310 [Lentzea flava]